MSGLKVYQKWYSLIVYIVSQSANKRKKVWFILAKIFCRYGHKEEQASIWYTGNEKENKWSSVKKVAFICFREFFTIIC